MAVYYASKAYVLSFSEALANVAKHSGARHATLEAVQAGGLLRVGALLRVVAGRVRLLGAGSEKEVPEAPLLGIPRLAVAP